MRTTNAATLIAALSLIVPYAVQAQVRSERPLAYTLTQVAANRPMLGITMATPTSTDTAGVRIESVNPEGPAAKAGLKEGMIITSINGVSLRVSPQDAADRELQGVAQRRLTRTLQSAKVGDEVELQILDGRDRRTVRVKTVAASELASESTRRLTTTLSAAGNRTSLGMSVGISGSERDTLGLFVFSVTSEGPAEKAGIVEGDRIAQINGIDLRVPREDVEDTPSRMARVTRFNRELQKVEAGSNVSLRVWKYGSYRDITVAAVKASDLPRNEFRYFMGNGNSFIYSPGGARIFSTPFDFNLQVPQGIEGIERERIERLLDEVRERVQDIPNRIRLIEPMHVRPRTEIRAVPTPSVNRRVTIL